MDLGGKMEGLNEVTGDRVVIEFIKASKPIHGKIKGEVRNKDGKLMFEIYGHWSEEVYVKDCETGESELVYKFPPMIENGERQFGFDQFAIMLNYLPDELK